MTPLLLLGENVCVACRRERTSGHRCNPDLGKLSPVTLDAYRAQIYGTAGRWAIRELHRILAEYQRR